jgi:hypothetical protein
MDEDCGYDNLLAIASHRLDYSNTSINKMLSTSIHHTSEISILATEVRVDS